MNGPKGWFIPFYHVVEAAGVVGKILKKQASRTRPFYAKNHGAWAFLPDFSAEKLPSFSQLYALA